MEASLVCSRNPFNPRRDRVVKVATRRLKISRAAREFGLDPKAAPTVCFLNGTPLMQKYWRRKRVNDGDICAFVRLPQGGGGGGSNPLKIVAMIAIIAFAAWVVGPAGLGLTGIGAQLTSAGIVIAGTVLVSPLLPPPK